ncbi:DUF4382 domain-containing protein [Paraflavisolibacter sp. H34]|uniref:DUF4382 domain-containing protein n=1 Tax=Huijunlia imazamoxiresistens TaxID=3127457 RepID=UPI0030192684
MTTRRFSAVFMTVLALFLFACSKKDASSTGTEKPRLQVYLTDDPGDYEGVYIDVQDIRINYTTDSTNGWQSLPGVKKTTYNLLTLTNDKDTLLADAELNTGRVEQIRLILGTENYVKVNGQMIKMETPSAQQSGLKLNIHQEIKEGILYKVLLDFDVAKSVKETGNKKYMLKPTIRTVLEAIGGSVKGYVKPATFPTAVLVIKGSDTVASTYTNNGGYTLKGLGAGTYDFHFLPTDTAYKKAVKNSVGIQVNTITTVDTVTLVK